MDISIFLYYTCILLPTAYILLTLALYTMSLLSLSTPRTTFYARTLAAYGTLIFCALYGVLASLLLRCLGHHRMSQYATARSFKWTMRYTTNIRFEIISGAQHLNTRPCVIIGNHQSALDILLLGVVWPLYCSVTAKSSLRYVPFLGWFMALSGTVFIDRKNRDSAIQAFDAAATEMREARQSVFIFPEGTRSNAKGPELGAFKKGAFHLAIRAQVPVVPVVCANYHGVLSIKERRFRAGRIPVKVLPPIETKGLTAADVDRLTNETREVMLRELIALTETPAGRNAASADPSATAEEDFADLVSASEASPGGIRERKGTEAADSGIEG
ncbi:MAG: hypothetical protein Q9164_002838 [Protoblastenia rupestris]